jgi:hypothetical protein
MYEGEHQPELAGDDVNESERCDDGQIRGAL